MEGALELGLAVDRAEDGELEVGKAGEDLEHAVEPLVQEAAAAEPEEAAARGREVLPVGPGVEERLRDRHRPEGLAGVGVGRLGRAVAQDRGGVGVLDRPVRLEQLVGRQPNPAPRLELGEPALLRRVVERRSARSRCASP